MADHSFLDWPFFTARHRELAAALEAWAQAHLPVGHADVDAACQELVRQLGAAGFCSLPPPKRAKPWMCVACA
ncbi:MAG: hypothetical protein R3E95_13860 [Thiolinea sp.]